MQSKQASLVNSSDYTSLLKPIKDKYNLTDFTLKGFKSATIAMEISNYVQLSTGLFGSVGSEVSTAGINTANLPKIFAKLIETMEDEGSKQNLRNAFALIQKGKDSKDKNDIASAEEAQKKMMDLLLQAMTTRPELLKEFTDSLDLTDENIEKQNKTLAIQMKMYEEVCNNLKIDVDNVTVKDMSLIVLGVILEEENCINKSFSDFFMSTLNLPK